MPTLKDIEENLAVYAGIATSAGTLTIPVVRRWAMKFIRGVWLYLRGSSMLIAQNVELTKMVKAIAYQVQANDGGSLKDSVVRTERILSGVVQTQTRLENYRKNDFWCQPRPGLEMDEHGQVTQVSEAACRLFRVSQPEALMRRSWLQFMDGRRVNELINSFIETAATESIFRFPIVVRDENGEVRGSWEFKATPLGPNLFSVYFSPEDAVAKEIAGRAGWRS